MITPKVMRRTPKVTGNLSMCADDWKTVESYKRMGQVFLTHPCVPSNSNSSEESFEATYGFGRNVATTSTSNRFYVEPNAASIATFRERRVVLSSCTLNCPRCPCRNKSSTSTLTTIDCCRRNDHAICISNGDQLATTFSPSKYMNSPFSTSPAENTSTQSSSDEHTNGLSVTPVKTGVLESHFPVYSNDERSEKTSLIPIRTNRPMKIVQKMGGPVKADATTVAANKRQLANNGDDRAFSRNEALPLLSNLNEKSSPSRFVKRKKCVYPMESSPRPSPSKKKTESTV